MLSGNTKKSATCKNFTDKLLSGLPVGIFSQGGDVRVRWINIETLNLNKPFFDQDIEKHLCSPNCKVWETSLDDLLNYDDLMPFVSPNGFIFHMSRCGSTLVSNIIRKIPGAISISEATLFDQILSATGDVGEDRVVKVFRKIVSIYGRMQTGKERSLVIKFPSYSTFFLTLITKAFPSTPHIFLYRNPIEVVNSNLQAPAQNWIFLEKLVGNNFEKIVEVNSVLKNCCLALRATCHFYLDLGAKRGIVINYSLLANDKTLRVCISEILNAFHIKCNASQLRVALEESVTYSKQSGIKFSDDKAAKISSSSSRLVKMVDRYLGDVYRDLERVRFTVVT